MALFFLLAGDLGFFLLVDVAEKSGLNFRRLAVARLNPGDIGREHAHNLAQLGLGEPEGYAEGAELG
ncbi:MAG: hypothetical protein RBS40_13545 [Rhodocyclaceae bacterium]|nr:hypothetical protein [Rhodocyclaceae bacterium]